MSEPNTGVTSREPYRLAPRALPVELTSFVGREHAVDEVRRLLDTSRLVTITGPGGVGKTRLATRVAREMSADLIDSVCFVDLSALTRDDLIAESILAALGLESTLARWPVSALVDHVAGRDMLIVLDNCEHIREACAVLADNLLHQAPDLRLLTTSRQTLGIPGEHVYRLTPLALPRDTKALHAGSVDEYAALNLLAQRVRAVRPDFEINDETVRQMAALCAFVDGIPLAIELAAARASAFSISDMLDRLTERHQILVADNSVGAPRHHSLHELVGWSWDLCGPDEKAIWARASVFRGSFDLAAAESICAVGGLEGSVLTGLSALVDKSIISMRDNSGRIRYRLLEILRGFGEAHLLESTERDGVLEQHRAHYADIASTAESDWFSAHQRTWLERLREEHSNFRVALQTSFDRSDTTEHGLALTSSLWFYWIATGQTSEARRWLARGLDLPAQHTPVRNRAMEMYAYLCIQQEDLRTAWPLIETASTAAHEWNDPVRIAWAEQLRGMAHLCEGNLDDAQRFLIEARDAHEHNSDILGAIDTTFFLASVYALRGDARQAEALYSGAIAQSERHGESWTKEYMLWGLAFVAWHQGHLTQARENARAALSLGRELNEVWTIAFCLELMAWVAAKANDDANAAVLIGAAEAVWRRLGWRKTGVPLYYGIRDLTDSHRRCVKTLRERLGTARFQAAERRGRAMSLDDAIGTALAGPHDLPRRSSAGISLHDLSRREQEVVLLIADGLSNKEIAARLTIAQRTAEAHVERILTKLCFSSRAKVAAWAVEQRALEKE